MTPRWQPGQVLDLEHALTGLAGRHPGRWAFAVREDGAPVAQVGADVVMPAASTIKVPLLVWALRDVASGRCRLDDILAMPEHRAPGTGVLSALPSVHRLSLEEALELMITISDNTATNMVIGALGPDRAGAAFEEMGLRRTRLRRQMMDLEAKAAGLDNVTTADEQACLLDRLSAGELLPDDLRDMALAVLGRQQFNDRLPARLGPEVRCLHKTGELPGIRHDVGILAVEDRWISVAAMACELSDPVSAGPASGPAADVFALAAEQVVALACSA